MYPLLDLLVGESMASSFGGDDVDQVVDVFTLQGDQVLIAGEKLEGPQGTSSLKVDFVGATVGDCNGAEVLLIH